MSYSIKAILHPHVDSTGLQKIQIRVIYNKIKAYGKTDLKVTAKQFDNGEITGHPLKTKMNALLRSKMAEIEERLLSFIQEENKSPERLKQIVSGEAQIRIKLNDFITDYAAQVKGKVSDATIQVYESLAADIDAYDSKCYLDRIDVKWLNYFEQDQRKQWEQNTINKKMKNIKSFLKRAKIAGYVKEQQYEAYKVPAYEQKIPEYLTEAEMIELKKQVDNVKNEKIKQAGMYFLLSCFAGYRISDLKRFNGSFIKDGKILLHTKKNGSIVSIPIHTRLKPVVEYCLSHPFTITEQDMRDHVKDLVKMAGIDRHIKIHTARHSFAMLCMDKGLDLEDVAELLGNQMKSTLVYARISNKRLEEKILNKLG